jgi:hypothetical protein
MTMSNTNTPIKTKTTKRCVSVCDPALIVPTNYAATEQSIWRAVLVQALMDASSNSKKKENMQWKEEALIWLRGKSQDFLTVCHYAGFEPDFVRLMVQRALSRDCVWRLPPGTSEKAIRNRASGSNLRECTQLR